MPCADPADVDQRLAAEYQEAVTARGIDAAGNLLLIYSNGSTGTWTVLIVRPNGPGCIVSTGQSWEQMEYAAPATGKSS